MSKSKSVFKKVVITILCILLIVVSGIAGLFIYSSINRKKPIAMLPHDYSVYIHTDSAWNTLEPLLDLKAVDMYLSTPEMSNLRGAFMQLRSSQWRNSKTLAYIASKPIDLGVYSNEEGQMTFICCIDLKGLSAITRFAPYYYSLFNINIENLNQEENFFTYKTEDAVYYLKPYKNMLLVSNQEDLLFSSLQANYDNYSKQDLQIINQKNDEPVKIIANSKKLLETVKSKEDNGIISEILKVIPHDSLSSISFKVTDNDIKLNAHIPYLLTEETQTVLEPILKKPSSTPSILSRFRENVQYYTILNAGTLEQLKDSFMPFFVQNADFNWKKYNGLSKAYLNITLDDLLFSWSGNEVVIFGIENKNDPVFAIQIKDEKQRQKVFEKFLSSVLVRDNSSLILDGIRIPRIELPSFLQELLELFDISLPKPYYLIQDGFIYFTESPENLCEIYKAENKIGKISADENWNVISKDLPTDSTVSLYYNLERSLPFFLKSNANLAKVLSLYSIGRADFSIRESELQIQLSAISKSSIKSDKIAGFPLELNGKVDGELILETKNSKAKTNALYWVENKKKLVSMEVPSTTVSEFDINDNAFICEYKSSENQEDKKIWCVTGHGAVYVMDRKFQTAQNYPLFLDDNILVRPVSVKDGLYITTESGRIFFVKTDGTIREIPVELSGTVKSSPNVFETKDGKNLIALYDKSFSGKVVIIQDWDNQKTVTFDVPGISYGSPAFLQTKNDELPLVSFITQNGKMYIWNISNGNCQNVALEGMFKTNVVAVDEYCFALSTTGELFRVDMDGQVLSVQIPNVTCNEAFVTVEKSDIYICPDGNVIYGFDNNLELLYLFPVKGWGRPVFADVDGDKIPDCFTLSVDNKLNAISMR